MNLHTETSYVDELDYLHDEAYRDLQHEVASWPVCTEGHPLAPDATSCETCTTEAREWASGLTPLQVRSALRMYEGETGTDIDALEQERYSHWDSLSHAEKDAHISGTYDPTIEYAPDELEEAMARDLEATRYARWTSLSIDEQEIVCEASEAEYAARYDRTKGRIA